MVGVIVMFWYVVYPLTTAFLTVTVAPMPPIRPLLTDCEKGWSPSFEPGIDTLKTCVVLDAMSGQRTDSNRELLGQGTGNLLAALLGGMPGAGTMGPTLVNLNSGGQTRHPLP